MKNRCWPLFAASAVIAAAVSCSTASPVTENIEFSCNEKLIEDSDDSTRISFDFSMEYPVSGLSEQALKEMQSTIIATAFGNNYLSYGIEDAIRNYVSEAAESYRDANLPILEIMKEEGGQMTLASLNWENYKKLTYTGSYKGLCNYVFEDYSFTGGAHGTSAEIALVFDEKTGKTLNESDIFTEGYEFPVSELLKRHLNDGREEAIPLFNEEITPNGNFSIDGEGVTFIYNQYEIAAYAYGIIRITVPAEEIKPYLKNGRTLY